MNSFYNKIFDSSHKRYPIMRLIMIGLFVLVSNITTAVAAPVTLPATNITQTDATVNTTCAGCVSPITSISTNSTVDGFGQLRFPVSLGGTPPFFAATMFGHPLTCATTYYYQVVDTVSVFSIGSVVSFTTLPCSGGTTAPPA